MNQMFELLNAIDIRLSEIGVTNIREIQKALNIIKSKDPKGVNNIREILSHGFRRLDEMGVSDAIVDKLSSDSYILAKSEALFNSK